MQKLTIVLLALAMTSCVSSRGFDRELLRSRLHDAPVVTEADIQQALDVQAQLPEPFSLGVYFSPPEDAWPYSTPWNWLGEDKDAILAITSELTARSVLSETVLLNDALVEGKGNAAVRLAAARAGADAVLIVNGASDIDRYNNFLGFTYFLLITPFFIPGTEADGLFLAHASLWDVRNQYLYLSVETEGLSNETRPAWFIEERRLIQVAKAQALGDLARDLSARLTAMSSR